MSIKQARQDTRVLGSLYRAVDPAMRQPDEQAQQLLAEHRRLIKQIPFIRTPRERQGDMEFSR
jgi:hypothetical protein